MRHVTPEYARAGEHDGPDFALYEALKAAARHEAKDPADYDRRVQEAARIAKV